MKPGEYPYRRGIRTDVETQRVWTIRQYAGYGSIEQANHRFKKLIDEGASGISIAFDLPTQLGYDSDDPMSEGEVGRVGVAVNKLDDMRRLFDGIDISKISTSMTINATAPILLLMYELVALERGISKESIRGTIQNDILKEFIARGNYVFPPAQSLWLSTLTSRYCIENLPNWNYISVSGYHMSEAGASPAQEIGFALSNGIAYIQALIEAGVSPDVACKRISFFFSSTTMFLEQISKFRAAREVWAGLCVNIFKIKDLKSARLRFHTQTAGVDLLAQDALLNISRVTIQALAAILGGTQSLHTNGFDEALALPSEKSAVLALNIQRIIAEETDLVGHTDPFGSSDVVEASTDRMVQEIYEIIDNISSVGGALKAVEIGYQKQIIEKNAFLEIQRFENGDTKRIFSSDPIEVLNEDTDTSTAVEVEKLIYKQLHDWKLNRNEDNVAKHLKKVAISIESKHGLFEAISEALIGNVTLGEISELMKTFWGVHDKHN